MCTWKVLKVLCIVGLCVDSLEELVLLSEVVSTSRVELLTKLCFAETNKVWGGGRGGETIRCVSSIPVLTGWIRCVGAVGSAPGSTSRPVGAESSGQGRAPFDPVRAHAPETRRCHDRVCLCPWSCLGEGVR